MDKKLIAISGGIGAGKTIVSQIVKAMGYPVYDCDSEAKRLMDSSDAIKRRLREEIHEMAIDSDNNIDRRLLAEIVFNDSEKLSLLNSIVHKSVKDDIATFTHLTASPLIFIETAILYQSGIDRMVDGVWEVTATENIRIERVIKRNNCTPENVADRIRSQQFIPERPHPFTDIIINDNTTPLLPQIEQLISKFI